MNDGCVYMDVIVASYIIAFVPLINFAKFDNTCNDDPFACL